MNPAASIPLLICSLAVVCAAGLLPFLNSDLRKERRPKFPVWTVLLAVLGMAIALNALAGRTLPPNQINDIIGLTAALVGGVCLKWTSETIAQRKFTVHESVLFRALLAAPTLIALCPGVFGSRSGPAALLLWFLNGFFWHTVFSDLERLLMKERVVIRRREPPTLPYDFRKPEID